MDVVRRNPKSFLSEKERVGISKVGLLIIRRRILIFNKWLVVYDGPAFVLQKLSLLKKDTTLPKFKCRT